MLKKLRLKLIVFQILALIFFIQAIFLLKITSSWNKYLWAFKLEPWSENEAKAEFIVQILLWRYYSLIIGVILLVWINWKRKIQYLNTVIAFVMATSMVLMNFSHYEIIKLIFQPREIIPQEMRLNFLIYSCLCFLIAWLLLLFSFKIKRNDITHNTHFPQ